ncbi:MAG: CsbD family protein [Polaromonas sp.]|nr:CsbD family protein [Polaromonas sp.]
MNKDQVRSATRYAAGQLVGNKKQQARGLAKQANGETRKVSGDAWEALKRAIR